MSSAAHFSTRFRHSTGEPPHRFHTRLRVERARDLLERGMDPATAAVDVGATIRATSRATRGAWGSRPERYIAHGGSGLTQSRTKSRNVRTFGDR